MRVSTSIILLGALLGLPTVRAASESPLLTNTVNYRAVLQCGPNSLFIFLLLSGHSEISLQTLKNEVPVSSSGTSLLSLRNVARHCGVHAAVRSYWCEDAGSMPLPAIVQFRTGPSSITPMHFEVAYKIDADRMYVLDATTGHDHYVVRSKLPSFWTGYALVENQSLATMCAHNARVALLAAGLLVIEHLFLCVVEVAT